MGIVIPYYGVSDSLMDYMMALVGTAIKKHWADAKVEISYRPIRPNEIYTGFTSETRHYNTANMVVASGTFDHILSTSNTSAITVEAGCGYIVLGWICIDSNVKNTGFARVKVDGVVKNEVLLQLVDEQDTHMLPTLDQVVVVTENQTLLFEVSGAETTPDAMIYPLCYKIGPKSQLDVT
jgi:hypothetical protein